MEMRPRKKSNEMTHSNETAPTQAPGVENGKRFSTKENQYVRTTQLPLNQSKILEMLYNDRDVIQSQLFSMQKVMNTQLQALNQKIDKWTEIAASVASPSDNQPPKRHPKGHKVFQNRESVITTWLQEKNGLALQSIVIAMVILSGVRLCISDMQQHGTFFDFSILHWAFANLQYAFTSYAVLVSMSMLVIPLANWSAGCSHPQSILSTLIYIALQLVFFASTAYVTTRFLLNPPLSAAFGLEQCRLSLKMHSAFREKFNWKDGHAREPQTHLTTAFLYDEACTFYYYLFAPTLIYRLEYPQTVRSSNSVIALHLINTVVAISFSVIIFRTSLPQFQDIDCLRFDLVEFVQLFFQCIIPGITLQLTAFYVILHSVQNLFGEILMFGDRQFYQDWWNSSTYSVYYRRWNGVVHDWIKAYIFLDFQILFGFNRTVSLLSCFLISAILHEYIIVVSMGFFFPILFILFGGPGVLFIFFGDYYHKKNSTSRFGNAFFWTTLAIGNSLLFVLYCREYYARQQLLARGQKELDFVSTYSL